MELLKHLPYADKNVQHIDERLEGGEDNIVCRSAVPLFGNFSVGERAAAVAIERK